ncbi:MAG: PD-(D/E)XK nuclease family protein, partial [Deltaproteobacteria bacterium]|nr:PD-(D/E)XK nuclease family protein [Deltaproteobacteria bacterium]
AVLDAALARHGVPRVGAKASASGSRALVRWVLETAFHPMDPAALHGLLCADPGPVPRSVARRLVRAFDSLPGRGSPDWTAALAEGLDRIEEERRLGVAVRISALIDPVVPRDAALTIAKLATRLRVLTTWAHGRVAGEPRLVEVIAFSDRVLALAHAGGEPGYGRMALRRLCDEVDRDVTAVTAAEVGLAGVTSPAALLGPARVVVWWGFTRDQAPRSPRLRLSEAERTGLAAEGVVAPDPGSMMAGEARRWRRPLGLATEALVLVCPRTDEASAATHPHPLWDEFVATMPVPDEALRLVTPVITRLVARRAPVALRPRLVGCDVARAPGPLAVRSPESPSSIERLLACSLAWALHYPAMLRRGIGTGPGDPNPLLYGNLAHHVLAEVFEDGGLSPADAAVRADALFEAALPALAEQLLLPEHQVERAVAKRAVVESAREVGDLLLKTGATIRGVEVPLTGSIGALAVDGRADLVLDNPAVVIDFKWGSTTYRKRMERGAALQLAIYAALAKTGATMPGGAYLSLGTQHIVASRGTPIAHARFTGTHSVDDMLSAALVGLDARVRELADGTLVAPAALEEVDDSRLDDGVLRIAPACEYCEFSGLCGQRVRP